MLMQRRLSFLWLAAALGLALAVAPRPAAAKVRKGDRAAELVQVKTDSGKPVRLSKMRDRVVVITFGASWCAPCRKELPAYEKLARKYRNKKVTFIAVNIDNEHAKGKKFMKEAGLKSIVAAFDTHKTAVASWDPPSMPSTFVIRKGVVRYLHKGYRSGDERGLAKVIDAQLAKL